MIKHLLMKLRFNKFCKQNQYNCPNCIYHNFIFEGCIFRGNKCEHPYQIFRRKRNGYRRNS